MTSVAREIERTADTPEQAVLARFFQTRGVRTAAAALAAADELEEWLTQEGLTVAPIRPAGTLPSIPQAACATGKGRRR